MICSPESKYGSEKSTAFSSSGVMVIAAIATSTSPCSTAGNNAGCAGRTVHVNSTCIRRATSFQRSTLKPSGVAVRGNTKGATAAIATRNGGCATGDVETLRGAEDGIETATRAPAIAPRSNWDESAPPDSSAMGTASTNLAHRASVSASSSWHSQSGLSKSTDLCFYVSEMRLNASDAEVCCHVFIAACLHA